ncbi:MAG: trypsin-like peptidase domain-containing protein [Desulfobulbaceae bacterium]|nr:trypsin-like peptidase domain-containing protein [Desulfobulbaceae bacterium]
MRFKTLKDWKRYKFKQYPFIYIVLIALTILQYDSYSQFFSPTKIYEKCADAVVLISTPYGTGTGFFINESGYIVTNHHVIKDRQDRTLKPVNITIQTKNGSKYNVIYVNDTPEFSGLDIAILKINGTNNNYLSLKPTSTLVGEEVVAIGHPHLDTWNQSKGIISKINLDDKYLIQHDVATDEGNSGGPLINSKGQVVGVVTRYKRMPDSRGFEKIQETGKLATNVDWVKKVLDMSGIKYYQNALVIEGMSEFERQFDELQKDKEQLIKDRELLRIEKENVETERTKLSQEKIDFNSQKQESWTIIERADLIRKEIENSKNINDKKWKELVDREHNIEKKEKWLREKEVEIARKFTNRLAFEILINPNYLYNQNLNYHYISLQSSVGLFLRFGFDKDYYNEVKSSDRIGFVYGIQKLYNIQDNHFLNGITHDLAFAIEFNDILRVGIGKSLQSDYNYFSYKDYNLAFISYNINGYPYSYGFNIKFYSDNNINLKNYVLGFYSGISLSFLRL